MAGINRALQENRILAKSNESTSVPCIFISHISIDKSAATAIGNYITRQGDIDTYLDITQFIERGLSHSTHIMCLVSKDTVGSWWVPYELGFAKKAGKSLSTMKLKGEVALPPFLEISELIRGTKGLNAYLTAIRGTLRKSLTETLIVHTAGQHPLDPYVDWNA